MPTADQELFPGFERQSIPIDDELQINCLLGGSGPPLLMLHGHPQTHAIWHRVAPRLAEQFTLVMADLRGYGDSSKPRGTEDHTNYSKRVMAGDMLSVMRSQGFDRFDVLAHDRGARVAHRLGADHPAAVRSMVLLDIAPTVAMYEQTNEAFARAYWHWFFLIQPAPLPERLIEADPAAYVTDLMGARGSGLAPFDPRALAEYQRCMALPGAAHGACEDYRAAAGIDLVHDRADRSAGSRLTMPLLVLWGEEGIVGRNFNPLMEWREVAEDVRGGSLPSGHYIAEEAPDKLLTSALAFLTR
jgi:haloacetate dehalogenase